MSDALPTGRLDQAMVATVGDNCIDRYLPPIDLSTVGGNAVNVAVHLARHGRKVAYFGAVGRDREGARTLAALGANGVITTFVHSLAGATASTDIEIGVDGDRRFLREDFGVCVGYAPDQAETAMLCQMQHVHLGWLDDGGRLKQILVAAGVSVSQDFSVNQAPGDIPLMFASAGPTTREGEKLAAKLLDLGARLAVVTMGAAGSLAADGKHIVTTNSRATKVVDTTGAGDTFIAGFLDAYLAGDALPLCLEQGRDAAASSCSHYGGFPQATRTIDGLPKGPGG